MNEQAKSGGNVRKPSTHFDEPHQVVDSGLSKAKKVETLDALEQDARQLAGASSEGIASGGRNKLHEVLIAKDRLGVPPAADN
jgi:hypothetical protein